MTNGKNVVYVDSNNFVTNDENQSVDQNGFAVSVLPDKIKYFSKNYYIFENNNFKLPNQNNSLLFYEKLNNDTLLLKANKQKFSFETIENGIITKKFDYISWQKFINTSIPDSNQVFFDYKVEISEPIDIATIDKRLETGTNLINTEFIYNFFSKKFENVVSDPMFNSNIAPSVFSFINKKTKIANAQDNLAISLGGSIPENLVESFINANSFTDSVTQYFNEYVKAYQTPETAIAKARISEIQTDVKIIKEKIDYLNKTSFLPFPFYCESQFTNIAAGNNNFIHKIEEIDTFEEDFITYFQNSLASNNFLNNNYIYSDGQERQVRFYDLNNFFKTFLGLLDDADTVPTSIENSIKYSNLLKFIKNNYNQKYRDFFEINKKSSTIEPILYKIEKIQSSVSQQPQQTFWISPNKSDVIKFIDTQIKYGNEYTYKLYVYYMVVGTQYSYENYPYNDLEKLRDLQDGQYKVKLSQKPVYKIGEFLVSETFGGIYEAPYTRPSVKMLLDNSNIRFVLDEPQQDNFEEYEILESSEYKIFENIRISQNNDEKNKIHFKKNPFSFTELQIYRTTTRPKNYLSFQGKLQKKVSLKDNQTSFIDNVFPNQTYYYTFRVLNEHGIPSNPSLVYQIMLEEQDGFFNLKQTIIDFKKPPNRSLEKNMKKYMLIRPSIIQTQPNYREQFRDINDVDLGPDREKVWGKEFVIRVTSKKTNKVLVFNVSPRINKKNS